MISDNNESTDRFDASDNLLNSFCILPNIWKLSLLDSDSNQYLIEGFEKYDKL